MAKRKLKLGTCYFIEWLDAYSGPNTWQTEVEVDEMLQDYFVWTLGWLQKETEHYYIFASTVARSSKADARSSVWAIPKGMIVRVREVGWDE